MGGYSSFPVCIASTILRIKFVIYENNLIIGKANKYLLPFAKKLFVSYKELEGVQKKYNKKILEIGNLIREEIINSQIFIQENDELDKTGILVLGGSQGARVFAEELPAIFKKLKNSLPSIKIYQQCQKNQNEQLSNFYKNAGIDYEIFSFSEKIINYYSKVNFVTINLKGRAGGCKYWDSAALMLRSGTQATSTWLHIYVGRLEQCNQRRRISGLS